MADENLYSDPNGGTAPGMSDILSGGTPAPPSGPIVGMGTSPTFEAAGNPPGSPAVGAPPHQSPWAALLQGALVGLAGSAKAKTFTGGPCCFLAVALRKLPEAVKGFGSPPNFIPKTNCVALVFLCGAWRLLRNVLQSHVNGGSRRIGGTPQRTPQQPDSTSSCRAREGRYSRKCTDGRVRC